MNFVTDLPILINWKRDNYNFILVIVDQLVKIIYYKPVKITINASKQAKVIINLIIWHYNLLNLIVTNKSLLFTSKFWLLLYYFFGIKWQLFTIFSPKTDSQTKWQINIIDGYLRAFVNFK